MKFLVARLSEASTWAGIAAVAVNATAAYATKDPQAIAATFAGLVAVLVPEKR